MWIYVSNSNDERKIALVSNSYALIFQLSNPDNYSNFTSNNISCSLDLIHKEEFKNHGFRKLTHHEIHGFIGLIEVENNIFIATITGSAKVASPIPGENVNKIYAVDFYCLSDSRWDFMELDAQGRPLDQQVNDNSIPGDYDNETAPLQQHPCFQYKKLLSNGSFYYSTDFDLTSILQERGLNNHTLSNDNFKREFMWNDFMLNEIISYRDRLDQPTRQILDDEGFLTTVIRGFAETVITYIRDWKVSMTIVSKQSWKRAGTRYNVRGINDEGYVANFVETEYIMYSNEYCYSYTQVRGSVPIFWEQDASLINPKIQITRSVEATQHAFDTHFKHLVDRYGTIHVVNLLSDKPSEWELTKRYRRQLSVSKSVKLGNEVLLTEFDFHRETSQEGFLAARKLLPSIKSTMLDSGYFSFDVRENRVISEQKGCFRTNCLDCLDRTNLVQQLISHETFKLFLLDFDILHSHQINNESEYMQKHNVLWANHGDQISQIYAGTNALKSSFTRKGKMSFAGAISDATKSVSRLYINNFVDKGKQQNIDGLLGRLPDQHPVQIYDPENNYITERLEQVSSKFTTYSNMNLFVGTYNVSGRGNKHADLSEWLFPIGSKFKPDIVVLGLQEVIELTAGSILNVDYSKSSFWKNLVTDCLNQYGEKYILLRAEQMASLIILLFVKEDKVNHVKQVEGSTKKTGFKGMTGNKGAVAIRFKYSDTSFCFVNAHLSAGVNNVEERGNDYMSINKSISFAGGRKIPQHDSIFWLGDLNYRISLDNLEVRSELSDQQPNYIERLLKYDQLTQVINSGQIFHDFCEPTLQFHPTYKYDVGTDMYDTSEKARTPSWTDRIVYKGNNLSPLAYSDAPLKLSDHKPVFAAYRAKVAFVDEAEKLLLSNQFRIDSKKHNHIVPRNLKPPPVPRERRSIDLINIDPRPKTLLEQGSSYKVLSSPEANIITKQPSSNSLRSEESNRKISPTPPPIPKRKSNVDMTMLEPRPITSSSSLAQLHTQPPPPPESRSSVSLKSHSSIGANSDALEMKTLNSHPSTTSINSELKKRPVPAIPQHRKPASKVSTDLPEEVPDYEDSLLVREDSLLMSHGSDEEESSILEMVIDSNSPPKNDSIKNTRSPRLPPVPRSKPTILKAGPPPSSASSSKDNGKAPPPVPSKKPVLNKITINK